METNDILSMIAQKKAGAQTSASRENRPVVNSSPSKSNASLTPTPKKSKQKIEQELLTAYFLRLLLGVLIGGVCFLIPEKVFQILKVPASHGHLFTGLAELSAMKLMVYMGLGLILSAALSFLLIKKQNKPTLIGAVFTLTIGFLFFTAL